MQDRHLYRGKRVDNGEWVRGSLSCQFDDNRFIFEPLSAKCYEVIFKTVSQCTGLKDKNGKLIYEGDIVKYLVIDPLNIFCSKETEIIYAVTSIVFDKDYCGFKLNLPCDSLNIFSLSAYKENVEIIGNIFDNSELLERKNHN